MTDYEITDACANAMGFAWRHPSSGSTLDGDERVAWDPLNSQEQSTLLANTFNLAPKWDRKKGGWTLGDKNYGFNLNRLICERVATMRSPSTRTKG